MLSNKVLLLVFGALVLISACFSATETAMMAINRYRLAHWVRLGKQRARLVQRLLRAPERLLGAILIGNTFANILATAIATALALHWYGERGVWYATTAVTFLVLIFAEILPKTLASRYPGRIALWMVWPLRWVMTLLYPLVWLANGLVHVLLSMLGMARFQDRESEQLSAQELQSAVYASQHAKLPRHQMLLRVLELESTMVQDIMVQRSALVGLDLELAAPELTKIIRTARYRVLPVYTGSYDNVLGTVEVRSLLLAIAEHKVCDAAYLKSVVDEAYFIPESTAISQQLLQFQKQNRNQAFVVDEYGCVQGMLTNGDIIAEVIGQWGNRLRALQAPVGREAAVVVSGKLTLRELNRRFGWQLPCDGPRTLSGLLVEHLQAFPEGQVSVKLYGFLFEVLEVRAKQLTRIRVSRLPSDEL